MHERTRTSSCTGASSLSFASAAASLLLAYARATIWMPYFACTCTYRYWGVYNGKCVVTSVLDQCTCTKSENEKEWVSMRTRVRGNEKIAVYVYYPSAAAVDAAAVVDAVRSTRRTVRAAPRGTLLNLLLFKSGSDPTS